ncbi:MAG TPA: allophanate hydrolase [Chthoniobacteraceae bacterium]|nr:allophanate hydrolase [Chthoniobacteraceae bacterium]
MNGKPTLRFPSLTLGSLRGEYDAGRDPADTVREVYRRIAERGDDAVWIHLPPIEEILAQLPTDRSLPLFGVPFAVKDNIDVANWPTTAACPRFAYTAERDATVVARLRAAGAIPIGKTNMDQFATGLVGTRSPYGIPRSVFDKDYISGGSSSGSAVAVAAGLVAFSLGTDTAGSGRVPAAFNDIVGLKPTRGLLSMHGVVPACRSLDCVSILARNVADAEAVLAVAEGHDEADAFSRERPPLPHGWRAPIRFGVPRQDQLEFFGDIEAAGLFARAAERLEQLGHEPVEIDFQPFRDAARLLYAGPWIAERLAAIQPFFQREPEALHPVVAQIIGSATKYHAVDTFRGIYELERLRKLAAREWIKMDVLLLPTTGTTYTVEELLADPIRLNTNLGAYTNFVNLLDLCGLAVPAGFRPTNGLPFGVTLLAPAFEEARVVALARQFAGEAAAPAPADGRIALAVVGAHLSGQPLNRQLTERGALLTRTCRTAPAYRLYALANTNPPKPGLVRTPDASGPGIEVEVWSLTAAAFGDFVAHVPPPMVIGTVELEDGTSCKGFLCEPFALQDSREITSFGGWRSYLSR